MTFNKSILSLFTFLVLVFVSLFSIQNQVVYAAVCPPGTNNEGAETTLTDPDSIEAFCSQTPEETSEADQPTAGCGEPSTFFGLPPWHKYLEKQTRYDEALDTNVCDIKIDNISDVWLIVAAVIEILLRLASLVAIGFIIYGGATYIMSQGQPDKTKQSLMTVLNALIGLVISVIAAAVVSYIAGSF